MTIQVGVLDLAWDAHGQVRHELTSAVSLNSEQTRDIVACSGPALVASLLGTMRPAHALALCDDLLQMLETGRSAVLPINRALRKASLSFHMGAEVYHTFHPRVAFLAGSDSVEQAMRQLCNNYILHLRASLPEDAGGAMVASLMGAVSYYLEEGPRTPGGERGLGPARPANGIGLKMNEFAHTLYRQWSTGCVRAERSEQIVGEARQAHQDLRKRLSL